MTKARRASGHPEGGLPTEGSRERGTRHPRPRSLVAALLGMTLLCRSSRLLIWRTENETGPILWEDRKRDTSALSQPSRKTSFRGERKRPEESREGEMSGD